MTETDSPTCVGPQIRLGFFFWITPANWFRMERRPYHDTPGHETVKSLSWTQVCRISVLGRARL